MRESATSDVRIPPDSAPLSTVAATALLKETGLRHVAMIMDGNRRWAQERHLPKLLGHQQGVKTLKNLVRHCGEIGLEALTVYAFSTENWRRGEEEVGYLMDLFARALLEEVSALHENNVRLRFIGDLSALSEQLQATMRQSQERLSCNTGLQLQVAVNYGSQAELLMCVKEIATRVQQGALLVADITEADIEQALYTAGLPSLDLLIRTGGESRLSNYLLWQAAYAELYMAPTLWPDFTPAVFNRVLQDFAHRQRRFGQ